MRTKEQWFALALRWVYENGLQHSTRRPTWVNQAFDMAYASLRSGEEENAFPPRDMQIPPMERPAPLPSSCNHDWQEVNLYDNHYPDGYRCIRCKAWRNYGEWLNA